MIYQIKKYGDGRYIPGMFIGYFWSWYTGEPIYSFQEAEKELNRKIQEDKKTQETLREEIVCQIEV